MGKNSVPKIGGSALELVGSPTPGGIRGLVSEADTRTLCQLVAVDRPRRDALWDERLLKVLPGAAVLLNPELLYHHGFPYYLVYDVDKAVELEGDDKRFAEVGFCEVLRSALRQGAGIALNPGASRVDWKFRAGDLECFHFVGAFYKSQPLFERHFGEPEELDEEFSSGNAVRKVDSGASFELRNVSEFLSEIGQAQLAALLIEHGIDEPSAAVLLEGEQAKLALNLYLDDYQDLAEVYELAERIQWLVPSHIELFIGPRDDSLEEFMQPLAQTETDLRLP